MGSAWDTSGKQMFWAILAGVIGWVMIEAGRLMVKVHAKKLDTAVKMHRITTEGRERKAEMEVAKLEEQR